MKDLQNGWSIIANFAKCFIYTIKLDERYLN